MQLFEELKKNFKGNENSFIHQLCYYKNIEIKAFCKLTKETVTDLLNNNLTAKERLNVLKYLFFVYSRGEVAIRSHFDPNDLFIIKNWNEDFLFLFERVEIIIESILNDNISNLANFIDEFGTFENCTFPDCATLYTQLFEKDKVTKKR